MIFIGYDLITDVAMQAVESMGFVWSGYVKRKAPIEGFEFDTVAHRLLECFDKIPECDVVLSSAPIPHAKHLKDVVVKSDANYLIWDLGQGPVTLKDMTVASVPFQMLEWDIIFLTGVSVHELGFSYSENRTFLLACIEKQDLLTPRLRPPYPNQTLANLFNLSKDIDHIPVHGRHGQVFHKETRPWSLCGTVLSQWLIKAGALSPKVGTLAYPVNGKLHRISPSEASVLVGHPLWTEDKVEACTGNPGKAVSLLLREPGMPVWVDLIERYVYENN